MFFIRRSFRCRRTTKGSGAGWNPADFPVPSIVVVRCTNSFGVDWCTHDFLFVGSMVWEEAPFVFSHDFWGDDMRDKDSHKSYRPITVLSYRLNHHLSGLDPAGYHFFNVVCHTLNCVLFLSICSAVRRPQRKVPWPALASSLLFAVHPIHCDAVSSIVGRADVLSGFFFCISFRTLK